MNLSCRESSEAWLCTCPFPGQIKHACHFVTPHRRRSFASTERQSVWPTDCCQPAPHQRDVYVSSSQLSAVAARNPRGPQRSPPGPARPARGRERTARCEPRPRPSSARFVFPRSGPLPRHASQYTCPQLVRLKDDFLCGGWKQRLQNTQLAMTRGPREVHARSTRGPRERRSPGADCRDSCAPALTAAHAY